MYKPLVVDRNDMSTKDSLKVGSYEFESRLLIGTGKYEDFEETRQALEISGADVITVAIRRSNIGQNPDEPNLLEVVTQKNTPSYPIQLVVIPLKMRCEPAS